MYICQINQRKTDPDGSRSYQRWFLETQLEEIQSIHPHAFGDGSGKWVAAAVYALVVQESGTNQGLIAVKARLA